MKTKKQKQNLRYVLVAAALALVIVTFTPLILHPDRIEPKLLSMPFTLWTSILITVILVLLTFLVSKLQDNE